MDERTLLRAFYRRKFSIGANTVLVVFVLLLAYKPIWLNASDIDTNGRVSNDKVRTKISRESSSWHARPSRPIGYVNAYMSDINDQLRLYDEISTSFRSDGTRWRSINMRNERVVRRNRRDVSASSDTSDSQLNANAEMVQPLSTVVNLLPTVMLPDTLTSTDLSTILNQKHNLSDILTLDVSNKQLKRLDANILNALPNLQHFDLSANELTTFDVHSVHGRLEWLDLSNNRIRSVDARHLSHLKYLDLTCNDILDGSELHINGLAHLQSLDISGNRLDALPDELFAGTQQLRNLQLMGNRFERIAESNFRNLNDIEVLNLSNNRIRVIENETFIHLLNLQYLDLAYNQLDKVSVRALQGIPDLAHLSVAFNRQLGNALQGFVSSWSLKYLDASGTGLCEVPSALAQSVHTLNISHNTFPVIRCGDLDSYPLLQHLDMSTCHINDIDDDAFGRLEILISLYLNDNYITRIPSSLPVNLIRLYLQNNRISDIRSASFAHLINLEEINLSGNQLMYMPGLPLPRLLTLDLRVSGLKGLSQSVVKLSPQLKDIFLDGNPIKCSELLSLAEWATPCRTEKPIDAIDENVKNTRYDDDLASTSTMAAPLDPHQSLRRRPCICKWCEIPVMVNASGQSQCSKRLINANDMLNNNVLMANGQQSLHRNDANVDKSLIEMSTNHVPHQLNSSIDALEHETLVTLMALASSTATMPTITESIVPLTPDNKMPNNNDVRVTQPRSSTNETLIERKLKNFNYIAKPFDGINHASESSGTMTSNGNLIGKKERFRKENDDDLINNEENRTKANMNQTKKFYGNDSSSDTIVQSANTTNDNTNERANLSHPEQEALPKNDFKSKDDLQKGKKLKKPKQSTKRKKQQSNKLDTASKTLSNDEINRKAHQHDDGQTNRTKQIIERLEVMESSNSKTSNPQVRAINDQQTQLHANNANPTMETASKAGPNDKLNNLAVNSSAIFTQAIQTPLIRSSIESDTVMEAITVANIADGMKTVTPLNRLDDGNTKQTDRAKQTDQVVNNINSGYKRDNSAINWNTNKAISKMNYTTSNEGMAKQLSTMVQPLLAASSTNARVGGNGNANDGDKYEPMVRGQAIGDRKINDKVEKIPATTTVAATAMPAATATATTTLSVAETVNVSITTATKKIDTNNLALLHKAFPLEMNATTMASTTTMTNFTNGLGVDETADDAHIIDHQQHSPNKHDDYDDTMKNAEKLNKLTDGKATPTLVLTTIWPALLPTVQANKRLNTETTTKAAASLQHLPEQQNTKNGTNVIAINEIRNNKYDKQQPCCTESPAMLRHTNDNVATFIRNNTNGLVAVLELLNNKVNRQTSTLDASLLSLSETTASMTTTTTATTTTTVRTTKTVATAAAMPEQMQQQQRDDNRTKSDNNNSNTTRNGKFMTTMQNRGKTNAINGIGYVPSTGSVKDMHHRQHSDWNVHNAHGTNQTIGPLIYSVRRSHTQQTNNRTQTIQNDANNHGTSNHNNMKALALVKQTNIQIDETPSNANHTASIINDKHPLPANSMAIDPVNRMQHGQDIGSPDGVVGAAEAISASGLKLGDHVNGQPVTIDEQHRIDSDQQHTNVDASGGLPEKWYDLRNTAGHPGLFIVVGIAIGVVISLGLIHFYRCRKRNRPREYTIDDERFMCITQANRDLLPMELLNSSVPYTDEPIELW